MNVNATSNYDDGEEVIGDEIVRSFVATGGKARVSEGVELALETLVEPSELTPSAVASMQYERKAIVASLNGPSSIAEISAELHLPLLSTQVLVSDLVSEGVLIAHDAIEEIDLGILESIRAAIVSL